MSKQEFEASINHMVAFMGKPREEVIDLALEIAFFNLSHDDGVLPNEYYRGLLHIILPSDTHLSVILAIMGHIPGLKSKDLASIMGGLVAFYDGAVDLDLGDD